MASLAELLVQSGVMTAAQLEAVKLEQSERGGSLDANVLALGYLTEHALQQIMMGLWDHPAKVDFTEVPSDEAIKLLDADGTKALQAVPLAIDGKEVRVLVHGQKNADAVKKAKPLDSYTVVPVAINEVRLRYLQEKFYQIERDERFVSIWDKLEEELKHENEPIADHAPELFIGDPMAGIGQGFILGGGVPRTPAKGPAPRPLLDKPPQPAARPPAPTTAEHEVDDEFIPILEEELLVVIDDDEEHDVDEGNIPLAEGVEPLTAADFQNALDEVDSMDGIPSIFFRFGAPFFHSMALFKVQSDMVMGWRGAGLGIQTGALRGIMVPTNSETFLARAVVRGWDQSEAGANAIEKRIVEQLGCADKKPHTASCAVIVGKRPVLAACGVTLDAPIDKQVKADLEQLAKLAAKAVVRLIMAAKKARG